MANQWRWVGACTALTWMLGAASLWGQPAFSVDFQGPPIAAPDSFPPGIPITEADILLPAPAGIAAPGPLPVPGTIIAGGPPPAAGPHLGLPLYAGAVGHAPGVPGMVEVDALSYGTDPPVRPGPPFVYSFSVDEFAVGVGPLVAFPPTVFSEGALGALEASADVYCSFPPGALPVPPVPPGAFPPPGNGLLFDGDGLAPPAGSLFGAVVPGLGVVEPNPPAVGLPDAAGNLDALDVDTAGPVFPVYFSLDSAFVDPIEGPPANSGSAAANFGFVGGDVLMKAAPGPVPVAIWAPAAAMGLDLFGPGTDDLDGLIVAENGCPGYQPAPAMFAWGPCGGLCPCGLGDMVLFSVRRGSAAIGLPDSNFGAPIEPGDILQPPIPFAVGAAPGIFISAESLGLSTLRAGFVMADDVDALDVSNDCNLNSIPDRVEIAFGLGTDCNGNGVPDACEVICGDGLCDPLCNETSCNCPVDCGPPPLVETPGLDCTDGFDNDCDGPRDCADPDCAADPACACGNGICTPPENPCTCPADCGLPAAEVPGPFCSDAIDNDCDGFIDCADPGCATDPFCLCGDGICAPPEIPCTCPADCGLPTATETGLCADTIDNDCDGPIDCADPDCAGDPACLCGDGVCAPPENPCTCPVDCGLPMLTEVGRCADGIDNDCDGPIDCADPDCAGDPACTCGDGVCAPPENPCTCPIDCGLPAPEGLGLTCADGIDNDCDGFIDCADPGCAGNPACVCGNGVCTPPENQCNCPIDCGPPTITEVGLCTDGLDNDCDGPTDCADPDCIGDPACLCGNGACDPGENPCNCAVDCGPVALNEVPGTTCTDGIDNDCDGPIDCADPDCTTDPACLCGDGICLPTEICTCPADCGVPPAVETPGLNCTDGLDNDCDNRTDCADLDCASDPACLCGNGTCSPGENPCNCPADCGAVGAETPGAACSDGIDNDCDGDIDCADVGCIGDPNCPCCDGDVNNNGTIDQVDLLLVGNCVNCVGPQVPACDVNCDGNIDLLDFGDELCLLFFPPAQCCPMPDGACLGTNLAQSCVVVPQAVCTLLSGTYLGDGVDCPPGAGDCNGNGIGDGCELQCSTNLDCDDANVCTCDRCLCNVCFHQPVQYGDANCDCIPPNLDDILCVLNGFQNYASCPAADIHPPCTGQGIINLDDILAVLAAFAGTNPCFMQCSVSCPVGACCDGATCALDTPIGCITDGHVYKGDGSLCPPLVPNPCP